MVYLSPYRSILHPEPLSAVWSVQGVLEVRQTCSMHYIVLTSFLANAVRYGTAKGEWFLNVVCLNSVGIYIVIS